MAETLSLTGRLRRGDLDLRLDLQLPRGHIAVVGPNGSGKSSLLRLVAGLDAIDEGEVVLDGTVVDRRRDGTFIPPEDRDVGVAFQNPRLFPHLRVIDNVAYPLRRLGRSTDAAHDLLARVGAARLADERPARLSSGQAQRVSIARALARGATTLLVDEPLAAIDEAGRAELGALLRALEAPRVVWVTHDPADAAGADVVVSIRDGVVQQTARS